MQDIIYIYALIIYFLTMLFEKQIHVAHFRL